MAILTNTKATPLLTKVVGKAGEAIPAFMGVFLDGAVIKYTTITAADTMLGTTDRAYKLGDDVAVIRRGESYAVATEVISVGDSLTCIAGEMAIANDLAGDIKVGVALIDAPAIADRFVMDVTVSN